MTGTVVTVAAAVFGILVVLAGALGTTAVYRVSRNTAVTASYKEAADSSQAVAAALRAEVAQLREDLAEEKSRAVALASKVGVLQELVSGRTAIEALTATVTSLTAVKENTLREVARNTALLEQITAKLGAA